MVKFGYVILTLLLNLSGSVAFATPYTPFPHSQARVVSSHDTLTPGSSVTIGLQIKLDPEWHSYWRNPGDSGASPIFDFSGTEGVNVSEAKYPLPMRIVSPPLTTFGYEQETMYLFDVSLEDGRTYPKTISLQLSAEWLVCKVECIPAFGDFLIEFSTEGQSKPTPESSIIDSYRSQLPYTLDQIGIDLKAVKVPSSNSIELLLQGGFVGEPMDFFTDMHAAISLDAPKVQKIDGRYSVTLKQPAVTPIEDKDVVAGLLVLRTEDGPAASVYLETRVSGSSDQASSMSFAKIIMFAFLGGLILNLMPCVFPVISIKLFSIISHAHGRPGMVQAQCLAYVAGVITSFFAVGLLLIALRAGGQALGWGFQLQSPTFLILLCVLFTMMAFGFLGLIEMNVSIGRSGASLMKKDGMVGQFFTGVLSTVVASPCTAPFMGVAMGAAITQNTSTILLTFAVLGLGLSSPYLLFALWPSILKFFPRPGSWMENLRQFMAFPLLATCIWLLWVLAQVAGTTVMAATLLCLVVLGLAVWVYRQLGSLRLAWSIAVIAIAFNVSYALQDSSDLVPTTESYGIDWMTYDETQIHDERTSGRLVFIDFTADWCITCKVNERVTFYNKDVQAFINEHNIAMFKADWTRRDPNITAALAEHNRIGVPLYLLWTPGHSLAHVLPEVLTPTIFINEVTRFSDQL